MCSLCRSVCDIQSIAFTKSFDRVIVGVNGTASTGYCQSKRTSFLFSSVINFGNVFNGNFQFSFCYFQSTKLICNRVVT